MLIACMSFAEVAGTHHLMLCILPGLQQCALTCTSIAMNSSEVLKRSGNQVDLQCEALSAHCLG
jgi:hypothetical protein